LNLIIVPAQTSLFQRENEGRRWVEGVEEGQIKKIFAPKENSYWQFLNSTIIRSTHE
jgi:hypothetical protein